MSEGLAASGDIEPPPWNEVLGPTKRRTGPNGVVLRGGKFVAAWGDVTRADMTFSVTKSYLATLAEMQPPDMPMPLGVLRRVEAPTLDGGIHDQIEQITRSKGPGDLHAALNSGGIWEVG